MQTDETASFLPRGLKITTQSTSSVKPQSVFSSPVKDYRSTLDRDGLGPQVVKHGPAQTCATCTDPQFPRAFAMEQRAILSPNEATPTTDPTIIKTEEPHAEEYETLTLQFAQISKAIRAVNASSGNLATPPNMQYLFADGAVVPPRDWTYHDYDESTFAKPPVGTPTKNRISGKKTGKTSEWAWMEAEEEKRLTAAGEREDDPVDFGIWGEEE